MQRWAEMTTQEFIVNRSTKYIFLKATSVCYFPKTSRMFPWVRQLEITYIMASYQI